MAITVAMVLSFHQVKPPHPCCYGERASSSPQAAVPMLFLSSCAGGWRWPPWALRAVSVPPLPSVRSWLQPAVIKPLFQMLMKTSSTGKVLDT